MDGIMENPIKIDDLGVFPIFGNTQMLNLLCQRCPYIDILGLVTLDWTSFTRETRAHFWTRRPRQPTCPRVKFGKKKSGAQLNIANVL